MGRPPGSRNTQPLFPSGVPNEAASRSRLVAGKFTFMALLKSILCAASLAGSSAIFFVACASTLGCWCASGGDSRAETPISKLILAQSESVNAFEEDIGTSRAQRAYGRQPRLELERHRQGILQANFSMETVDERVISLAVASPSMDQFLFLEVEA